MQYGIERYTLNAARFLMRVVRWHPQFLLILARIAWRNVTALIDYHMNGRSLPPKGVTFRISGQCDLKCQMCIYRNAGFLDTAQMLPLEIFKKVIDQASSSKPFITFTGGEPLLHPEILECLSYVKEKGLYCSLTTNGLRLAQYAEGIAKSGLDLLVVSLDGPQEVHDRIRGRAGAYQKALEGIRKVKGFARRLLLFVNTSIQADSYQRIEELVDELVGLGVDGMNVAVLWTRPPERSASHNRLFPEYSVRDGWIDESLMQIDFRVLEVVLNRARKKDLFVNFFPLSSIQQMRTWYTDPRQLLNGHRLKCPWMMANVFHDGTMRMCDDIVLGDLKIQDFWEIWNGEKMARFRRTLRANRNFPICAGCCSMFRDRAI
jgi:MoaA/NifB/PqqE/SkfB family radical SAM enzyme